MRIGIDVGGTFTDLVVTRVEGGITQFKTPSTPKDPSIGVFRGLTEISETYGVTLDQLLLDVELIVHGTTVATNTLVERVRLVAQKITELPKARGSHQHHRFSYRINNGEISARRKKVRGV